jgi:drug/metabolite transporter (DMT)-like permease
MLRMSFSVMLLVLLGAGLHATWNGLVKGGTDRYLDLVGLLAASAVLILLWLPFLPAPSRAAWPYLAVSTVIHQFYFTLIALSYRKGDLSLVYPITRGTAPAFTALGAALLLHERSSALGVTGVCLVSAGVLLFALDRPDGVAPKAEPILLALANSLMIVLYTLVDGSGVRLSGNAFSYTSWGFLLCALFFCPFGLLLRRKDAAAHLRRRWTSCTIGAACSIASYALALWAMTCAPIAAVAALRETSILFGVIIAVFHLKERITPRRLAAIAVVLAGVAAIKLG